VVAPASVLFPHLLGLDGRTVANVERRLNEECGGGLRTVNAGEFRELQGEIAQDRQDIGERWVSIAENLEKGDYGSLLNLLVEQKKCVMSNRGGAAWIDIQDGRFHVRFRDEQEFLPRRRDLPSLWRFPYFLNSLRSIASALKEI